MWRTEGSAHISQGGESLDREEDRGGMSFRDQKSMSIPQVLLVRTRNLPSPNLHNLTLGGFVWCLRPRCAPHLLGLGKWSLFHLCSESRLGVQRWATGPPLSPRPASSITPCLPHPTFHKGFRALWFLSVFPFKSPFSVPAGTDPCCFPVCISFWFCYTPSPFKSLQCSRQKINSYSLI